MNAFYKRKRQWEFENEQRGLIVIRKIADVTQGFAVFFVQLTSFLLFVMYQGGRFSWMIFYGLLVGPRLVRKVHPGEVPEEIQNYEFLHLQHIPTRKMR